MVVGRVVLGSGETVRGHRHGGGLQKWREGGTEDEDYRGQADGQQQEKHGLGWRGELLSSASSRAEAQSDVLRHHLEGGRYKRVGGWMWVGWRRGVGKGSWLGNATEMEVMKATTASMAYCCRENKE